MEYPFSPDIDFAAVHASFDGYVKACTGKSCGPRSCCSVTKPGTREGFRWSSFFLDDRERDYVLEQNPGWEEKGILVEPAETRGRIVSAVGNCLGDGGCKLDVLPLLCKIVPFSLFAGGDGISTSCPVWDQILRYDDPLIERVMQLRTLLGFTDNDNWYKDLAHTLDRGGRAFPMI